MKTNTGLWIIHNGKRVDVYTTRELQKLQQENRILSRVKRFLQLG